MSDMSEHEKETYKNLLGHMRYHNVKQWLLDGSGDARYVKQWLLDGCKSEDARTIGNAVEQTPSRRVIRRLMRVLSLDDCERDAKTIRNAVEQIPSRRLIRRLARVLAR
jgi:hypothetical protein